MDSALIRIQRNIDVHGCHVIILPEDDEGPGFAYSIGLFRTLNHPEVIIFGLELNELHRVVNLVAAEVRRGGRFEDGDSSDEIFDGCPAMFRKVAGRFFDDYLGQAIRYYGDENFPAIQCFWPDENGQFPWHSDYAYGSDTPQPLLQVG